MNFRLHYNAPVILTFSLVCAVVFVINAFTSGALTPWVSLSHFSWANPFDYITLFTHCIGHASADHLLGNLTFILLLGPVLEEKYGAKKILLLMAATAMFTAVLNLLFFHEGLWGASGIVFMFIMLISFVNVQAGKIPITFILILVLFIGREVYNSFDDDNVSQFAHIMGGIIGSLFGFIGRK